MAKQIIILEQIPPVGNSPRVLKYALWAQVPSARQSFYADATKTSAYKGASAGELTAIQAGAVLEKVDTLTIESGTGIASIQSQLVALFTAFQNAVTNDLLLQRYGTFYDGTTWTLGGS